MSREANHLTYRADIDGMRAIAVVAVIFYHAGLNWFAGGFVGVDVFFVISGYLITSLILVERESGSFSIRNFYERRARRILPALFLVMLACIPAALLLMTPEQTKEFFASLAAVSLFGSNFLFWHQSDYFATAAVEKPLLHTWSLGVEEQYYIFFPLLVILLWRPHNRRLAAAVIVIIGASLLLSEYGSRFLPVANFYLIPFRAWELMIGSLLGLDMHYHYSRNSHPPQKSELAAIVGLGMIAASVFLFRDTTPVPSLFGLLPTVGTALVIRFAQDTQTGRLLSLRLLTGIGLISYSAYLWHQPLMAFARVHALYHEPAPMLLMLLGLLSFGLAWLSWRFVEMPFRKKGLVSRRAIFLLGAGGSAFFLLVGAAGYLTQGFFPLEIMGVSDQKRPLVQLAQAERDARQASIQAAGGARPFEADSRTRILIIGDSHAEDLFAALAQTRPLAVDFQFRYLNFDDACLRPASAPPETRDHTVAAACRAKRAAIMASRQLAAAQRILLSFRWSSEGARMLSPVLKEMGLPKDHLVVVGRTAEFRSPPALAYRAARQGTAFSVPEMEHDLFRMRDSSLDSINVDLKAKAAGLGIPYLDRAGWICDFPHQRCDFVDGQLRPYYFDYGHWSVAGEAHFGMKIFQSGALQTLVSHSASGGKRP